MRKPLVVNLFGGPGAGKSTIAAGVFYELKLGGINCELVTEYAKDLFWDKSDHVVRDQLLVFAQQYHRLWRLFGKVDVIVTDSPILLCAVYDDDKCYGLHQLILTKYRELNNLNIMLNRVKKYNQAGRWQNELEAHKKDVEIEEWLKLPWNSYTKLNGDASAIPVILNLIRNSAVMKEILNGKA